MSSLCNISREMCRSCAVWLWGLRCMLGKLIWSQASADARLDFGDATADVPGKQNLVQGNVGAGQTTCERSTNVEVPDPDPFRTDRRQLIALAKEGQTVRTCLIDLRDVSAAI